MIQQLSKWILYKRLGWTKEITIAHPEKYIICLAPHTSNWDLLIGQLYAHAEGIKSNFLMKKEWFFWPLGPIFRKMGGIPIWRSKHTSMTDNLAEEAASETTSVSASHPREPVHSTPTGRRDSTSLPSRQEFLSCSMAQTIRNGSLRAPSRLYHLATWMPICEKSSCTSKTSRERSLEKFTIGNI